MTLCAHVLVVAGALPLAITLASCGLLDAGGVFTSPVAQQVCSLDGCGCEGSGCECDDQDQVCRCTDGPRCNVSNNDGTFCDGEGCECDVTGCSCTENGCRATAGSADVECAGDACTCADETCICNSDDASRCECLVDGEAAACEAP